VTGTITALIGQQRARRGAFLSRAAFGGGLLAGSWAALHQRHLQRLDVRIGDDLRLAGSPTADRWVASTTDLGSLYGVAGVALMLRLTGRREAALDVAGVGTLAWLLSQQNKRLVGRERPYETHGTRRLVRAPTGSSFPSGHSAVGTAIMSTLADQARGPRAAALLHALGAYVPASRIYVGVHYPTDAIGGAGLGLLLSALWRGPVARLGRGLISGALRGAAFSLPPVAQARRYFTSHLHMEAATRHPQDGDIR